MTHVKDAKLYQERLQKEAKWKNVFIIHKAGRSELYWGRYPSIEAAQKNLAKFQPELDWLQGLGWLVYSRHYNYPYRHYLADKFAKDVGGKAAFHENPAALEARHRPRSEVPWRTRCDWDWRLAQEVDGSIAENPSLQKWLKRVRGPVVTKKPESLK